MFNQYEQQKVFINEEKPRCKVKINKNNSLRNTKA